MAASAAAFPHSFNLCLHTPILEEHSVSTMASICEIPSYEHIVKEEKSKILVIGGTGYIGRFVALAAANAGHPTYALIRPITASDAAKEKCLHELKDSGVNIVYGDLSDHKSMVKAMQGIDVVISIVGGGQLTDQLKIVDAIREIGTVKRFLPSEFGHDIPPPEDQFEIYGDGNIKAYFVAGEDIGMYTIKALEDDRTVNKSVHFRPPKNFLALNELAAIWEKKIGKTLPRVCISEQDLLDLAKGH